MNEESETLKFKAQAEKGNSHLGAKLRDLINELKLEELRNRQMKESEEMQHWIKKVQASNERLDKSKKKMRAKLEKQTIEDHDSEAVDAADALAEVKDEAEAAPDEVAGEVPAKPGYLPPDETPTTTEPPTKVAEADSEAVEVAKAPDEKIAATKEVATEDAFAEETAATKAASAEAEELPDEATADVEPAEVEEAVTTAKDPDEETVPENKADPTEEAYPANKLEVPLDEFPAAITEAEITKAAITEAEAAPEELKTEEAVADETIGAAHGDKDDPMEEAGTTPTNEEDPTEEVETAPTEDAMEALLGNEMVEFHESIGKARVDLEKHTIDKAKKKVEKKIKELLGHMRKEAIAVSSLYQAIKRPEESRNNSQSKKKVKKTEKVVTSMKAQQQPAVDAEQPPAADAEDAEDVEDDYEEAEDPKDAENAVDAEEKENNYIKKKMTPADLKAGDTKRSLDIKSPVVINYAKAQSRASFITYVHELKRKMQGWGRQRFQLPRQWLHEDNIDGEWGAFNEIKRRKDSSIQDRVNSLQVKIVAEDKAVERRTQDYLAEWEKSKPVEGAIRSDKAMQRLAILESKYSRLKEEREPDPEDPAEIEASPEELAGAANPGEDSAETKALLPAEVAAEFSPAQPAAEVPTDEPPDIKEVGAIVKDNSEAVDFKGNSAEVGAIIKDNSEVVVDFKRKNKKKENVE